MKNLILFLSVFMMAMILTGCNDEFLTRSLTEVTDQPVEESLPTEGGDDAEEEASVVTEEKLIRSRTIGNRARRDHKGYEQIGTWSDSRISGHRGSVSRYSQDQTASVQYTTFLSSTNYCVSVYRITHPNSTDKALVEVQSGSDYLSVQTVNHRLPEDQKGWIHLGVYPFQKDQEARVTVSHHPESNGGILRADEVRFKRVRPGFDCQGRVAKKIGKKGVIDNRSRATSGYREQGTWQTSSLPGYRGKISRYSHGGQASATFTALTQAGDYCVSLFRVTHPNSTTALRVTVSEGQERGLLADIVLDSSAAVEETGWVEVGTVSLSGESAAVVKIQRDESDGGRGVLRADAVRFVRGGCQK